MILAQVGSVKAGMPVCRQASFHCFRRFSILRFFCPLYLCKFPLGGLGGQFAFSFAVGFGESSCSGADGTRTRIKENRCRTHSLLCITSHHPVSPAVPPRNIDKLALAGCLRAQVCLRLRPCNPLRQRQRRHHASLGACLCRLYPPTTTWMALGGSILWPVSSDIIVPSAPTGLLQKGFKER